MYFHTDYNKFKKYIKFYIADSGTPKENIDKSLKIVDKWKDKIDIVYYWCETSEIRKDTEALGLIPLPASHAANIAFKELCKGDVILLSVIGMVYTPTYFENIFLIHMKNKKAFLQPKRFDLVDNDYHTKLFNVPFDQLDRIKMVGGGGLPDFSLRREHMLAVGGWDERFTMRGVNDMDFCVRMTGKMDNGIPCFNYFPNKPIFKDYGLEFIQPEDSDFFSLTCNLYHGHISKEERQKSIGYATNLFLDSWGTIVRNEYTKYKINYEVLR